MRALPVLLVVLALAAGCSGGTGQAAQQPTESGACGPVEQPPLQAGLHLLAGAEPPVPYSSTPPTSGWHAAGEVTLGVRPPDQPMTEPEQVTALEMGAVVITHGPLADADRQRLEDLAEEEALAGTVVLTSYDQLGEGEVAIASWGALRRCEAVDPVALRDFARTYASAQSGGQH